MTTRFGLLSCPSCGLFLSPVAEPCLEAEPCVRGGARTGEFRSLLEHKLCLCLPAVQHTLPTSPGKRKSWLNSLSSPLGSVVAPCSAQEGGRLEMTGLALPLLQCCHGRSASFQTRKHLMCSMTLSWRASAQNLETPRCRATSVSHGKRGRVHLIPVTDLSTATHPLTLQQWQTPSRTHPRVTLCQQQCWCHGNPRVRSGWNTLTEFSSSSTMPTRCDQCCILLLGMILGIPWGRDRAALTDNLSKQFSLNTLLIASNSKGLSGRNHSDILYQAPSEMGQEILRTSLWLLMWLAAQSAPGGLWGWAVAGRVEAVGLRCQCLVCLDAVGCGGHYPASLLPSWR